MAAVEKERFWKVLWRSLDEIRDYLEGNSRGACPPAVEAQLDDFFAVLSSGNTGEGEQGFLAKAARQILREWEEMPSSAGIFQRARSLFESDPDVLEGQDVLQLFFPEARWGGDSAEEAVQAIRKKRLIHIDRMNPQPLEDPASQMIFTSNVLLTLPPDSFMPRLEEEIRGRVEAVLQEEQKYWFDHPILMGVERKANEMIYGLQGLAQTFRFEKKEGMAAPDARLTVILSLSVTHEGLKALAHDYLAGELAGIEGLDDLDVYLFTEEDTQSLASLLEQALHQAGREFPPGSVARVFGVDGRYGRHYSFLKAVVPLWSLVMDEKIKGTFKIDLDQVFPQKELLEETGLTAFGHFKSPLWGAGGRDREGRPVELGMIAGALVNEKDIGKSLFTPDVPLPDKGVPLTGESRIFHKQRPMAVSTLAEMMSLYAPGQTADGEHTCLSRVHVTGGTNGILCSSLRRLRPFTPGFIGRAEDQAYLLSVLFKPEGALLRYVHKPGLIMRHDKDAFAGASIAAAKQGTWVADLLRLLYFSAYASFLPGGIPAVKDAFDPFSGCFISEAPMTLVFLRLVLKILSFPGESGELLALAEQQLGPFAEGLENPVTIKSAWDKDRQGWDAYYDALDILEKDGKAEPVSRVISGLRDRLNHCRILGNPPDPAVSEA